MTSLAVLRSATAFVERQAAGLAPRVVQRGRHQHARHHISTIPT